MRKILSLMVIFSFALEVAGQTVFDTNPSSLKWRQVNTPNFRVLFPKGFDLQAQRVANTLEHIRTAEAHSMGRPPRKISIVLQNQSASSNGFVSILPRRSEFFTMPPQNYNFLGTNDWLDLLTSHEYRHVVQYQHATRGFNRLFYYLFGSTTLAAMAQAAAPQWFWEGDAVATETAFTHSGRGRIPNFGMLFRTNLLSGRTFNYHKQYLRSYKNNIPDHYVLGYYMVGYLRSKTDDPNIWAKITARSWNVPFLPFAFSNAIHHETGLYVTDLFKEMAASLKDSWQHEVDLLTLTPFERVNHRTTQAYTDYAYPQPLNDGSVLAMKRGIGDIEKFVLLKDGSEHKQYIPGFINDAGMLSAADNKVVWSEYGFDPRWGNRSYSVIKVYDLESHRHWVVGKKHDRLSGAALSHDGKRVAAIRSDKDYKNSLVVLDVNTSDVLKIFPAPENTFYAMPRWSDDGKKIAFIKSAREGKTLSVLDVESESVTDALPVSQENLGHPVLSGSFVFFNSPFSGIDNLYALNLVSKERFQLTSSKFGAYNPSVSSDGKTIYYNEQTKDGFDVVKIPFDKSTWVPFASLNAPNADRLFDRLEKQEGRPTLLDSVPQTSLPVTKYSKLAGIINPYNWGAYVTNDLAQINIGITSRDILSTTAISAGYAFDINEGTSLWKGNISYQGLYPIIDFSVQAGDRENRESGFGNSLDFTWEEFNMEGGLRLPLRLTQSRFGRNLTLSNAIGYTKTSSFENTVTKGDVVVYRGPDRTTPVYDTLLYIYNNQLNNGDLVYNHATLSFYNLLKRSRRDFLSRWGQTLDVDLYSTPYGGDFQGNLLAARTTLYFPGLFKHHYLYGRFAYQESLQGSQTNVYAFRNKIPKPRGHSYPADETFYSLSANYSLPLWYPDIALGPVLNIQRIKTNFFYDYGHGDGRQYFYNPDSNRVYFSTNDEIYQSVGAETTFDINIMRFLPKFELGLRTTYRFANAYNTSGMVVEFLIGNIGF